MAVNGGALVANFTRRFAAGLAVHADLEIPVSGFSVSVLFGPSGGGKTTVLRCLAGLDRPTEGSISWGVETWFDAARGIHAPPQRRDVGYLAQDYALFPHLNVVGNIGYGLSARERGAQVGAILELFGIFGLEDRYPRQLSGGQQQRVALAQALVRRPRLVLLDEPLTALDMPTREAMRGELRRWLATAGAPVILVTHDRIEALALGDRVIVLAEGKVLQAGPVLDVFTRPASEAVARLVGVETIVAGRVLSVADGLATLAIGGARLIALANDLSSNGDVFACIRGEDVVVGRDFAETTSARNRLPARVLGLVREGPLVRVCLDCGFRLTALVTAQSCRELGLQEGDALTVLVKAPAVHLVPRADIP